MKKGKLLKNGGFAIMILGLIYMVIAYMKSDNINYVLGGLFIVRYWESTECLWEKTNSQ